MRWSWIITTTFSFIHIITYKECFICCLCHRHPSSKVLMSTAITPFTSLTCRYTIPSLACWSLIMLIKVLAGGALLWRWAVEIVEHQVHVCPLLTLQMIYDRLISVYFNLYIPLGLSRQSTGLMKIGCCGLLGVNILQCFHVVTYIKGLSPHSFRFIRLWRYVGCFLLYTSIWVKSLRMSSAVIYICRRTIFMIRLSRVIEMGGSHRLIMLLLALLSVLDGASITVLMRWLLGRSAFYTAVWELAVVFIW